MDGLDKFVPFHLSGPNDMPSQIRERNQRTRVRYCHQNRCEYATGTGPSLSPGQIAVRQQKPRQGTRVQEPEYHQANPPWRISYSPYLPYGD